jgi:hypothetical protein
MFAQAFRSQLLNRGIILHPVTDSSNLAYELDVALRTGNKLVVSGGPIVRQLSADLVDVGTDLSDVPLDEVLNFRQENKVHYVAYANGLREFLTTQATLSAAEQNKAQQQRRLLIQEQAAELRKISGKAFGIRSAALLLGLVGAAWTAAHGDNLGSIFAALTASTSAIPMPESTVSAYSYLLKTRKLS